MEELNPSTEQSGFFDAQFVKYYEQTDNTRQIDRDFYLNIAKQADGPVLDIGCGSGRLFLPMVEAGVDVHGFDSSPIMLEALSAKLAKLGKSPRIWVDWLETFEAEEEHYTLALCSFNTFLHLLTHEGQIEALRRVHRSLRPGGTFVFDITNPFNFDIFSRGAMGKTFEATLYDGETDTETNIWRWFERDLINQIGVYHRDYEQHSGEGANTHQTSVTFRWTYPSEMQLLLEMAGFTEFEVRGDFDGEPLDEESEMQVWVATK